MKPATKQWHVCSGRKDPQDILSFAILEADRLIRNGEVQFIQNVSAMNELSSIDRTYQTFQPGWAIRPKSGTLYGSQEIVNMLTAEVEETRV